MSHLSFSSVSPLCQIGGLCLTSLGVIGTSQGVWGLPQGGQVQSGEAQIRLDQPGQLEILQTSPQAVIHWDRFDIGVAEQVYFQQPSFQSATLNRVTGRFSSQIAGQLQAVGQVLLINPNGIVFTPTAQVDVSGILATTLDLQDPDFFAGHYRLQQRPGLPLRTVENYGSITVREGGFAALVAPGVVNQGVITARLGQVALGAGTAATLDFYGDGLLSVTVDPSLGDRIIGADGQPISQGINQAGTLSAEGGVVALSTATASDLFQQVINLEGVVQARSLQHRQGQIVLSGGDGGQVALQGSLDASGLHGAEGGQIDVTGARIWVSESAVLSANGGSRGGQIGVVASDTAQIDGALQARGIDGGHIETSAQFGLGVGKTARIDVGSAGGQPGTWRLDPERLVIDATSTGGTLPGPATGDHFVANTVVATALEMGNVDLEATERIEVRAPIDTSGQLNSNRLNFKDQNADRQLVVDLNAPITLGTAQTLTGEATQVNVNVAGPGTAQTGVDIAAPGGTVNLSAGTFTGNGLGESVVTINQNLTLQGQSATDTIIDGGSEQRGIQVESGTVGIRNLQVTRGSVAGELGTGGGISIDPGATVTATNLRVENSSASIGGGIFNGGNLQLVDSVVTGNTAFEVDPEESTVTGGVGGGVLNSLDATLAVTQSTISNNRAEYAGGGIGNFGTATISDSVIADNGAEDEAVLPGDEPVAFGGGIGNVGTLTVTNSKIENNQANVGGGIVNSTELDLDPSLGTPDFSGELNLIESQVTGNTASIVVGTGYEGFDYGYGGDGGGIASGIGTTVQISQSSVSNNLAQSDGGGIYVEGASLTIDYSEINENISGDDGGGLDINAGLSTINHSSIRDNEADSEGGGINLHEGGTLIINGSTIAGNRARQVGGLLIEDEDSVVAVVNSTLSENVSEEESGGGVGLNSGVVTIVHSTITNNQSGDQGGGISAEIFDDETVLSIQNSIISGNTAINGNPEFRLDRPSGLPVPSVSKGFNLVGQNGNAGGFPTIATDLILSSTTNSVLDPVLRNNGGPTLTHQLVAGSPAIDAGSNALAVDAQGNPLTRDQRGAQRNGLNGGTIVDIGAVEATSSYVVNQTQDSPDIGTLRSAVDFANFSTNHHPTNLATPAPNTIRFDRGVFSTLQTLSLTQGELLFNNPGTAIALAGPGANLLAISGGNASRVLSITQGIVTLDGLTVTDGFAEAGAGIQVGDRATLTLMNSTLTGNQTSDVGEGGGLFNSGTTTLVNTTVSDNQAGFGGGIYNRRDLVVDQTRIINNEGGTFGGGIDSFSTSNRPTAVITNSEITGNTADLAGGIYSNGDLTLQNVTLSGNTARDLGGGLFNAAEANAVITHATFSDNEAGNEGGGIYNSGSVELNSSFIGGNHAPTHPEYGPTLAEEESLIGTLTSDGFNLVGQNGDRGGFPDSFKVLETPIEQNLAPLAFNGSSTQTHALLPNSPALDGASNTGSSTDQRGIARPQGAAADIGAFESRGFSLTFTGSNQQTTVNTQFPTLLSVTVQNEFGEPVQGGTITFTPPLTGAGLQLMGPVNITLNAAGQAQFPIAANTTAGAYGVVASAAGLTSTANFNLTNLPGSPSQINIVGGSGQTTPTNTEFSQPITVQVLDEFGNDVPNATVSFTAATSASGASANFSSNGTVITNSNGEASVTAIANEFGGSYAVTASSNGLTSTDTFFLTNALPPQTRILFTADGDGGVRVTVDAFGAFGSSVTENAFYDPVGNVTTAGTTFESGIAILINDQNGRRFLTAFNLGGQGNLTGAQFSSSTDTAARSQFTVNGLTFALNQRVADNLTRGTRSGSILTQAFNITNTNASPVTFELIRYFDGDLQFDGSIQDGGGRLFSGNREILFETDQAGLSSTATTFVGITGVGGNSLLGNRFEVDAFSGLRSRIIAGNDLDDMITGDSADGDQFVDAGNGYDITLAFRNLFQLNPGESDTYITETLFGSGIPDQVINPPTNPPSPPPNNPLTGVNQRIGEQQRVEEEIRVSQPIDQPEIGEGVTLPPFIPPEPIAKRDASVPELEAAFT
ncbi:choice-of-anchor Q domain-containing protein, partial [Lyngbya confervoides]